MSDTRRKDWNWSTGKETSWEGAKLAVLMDIRDELQALNRLLACPNFVGIPQTLRAIKKNTTKPRKRKVKA